MKDKALEYLKNNWSVIPVKSGSKLPNVSSWKEFQARVPTEHEITTWWTKNPNDNIALVCGRISGVIVVDVDSKGKDVKEIIKGIELPPTLCARTGGGGVHYFYKWNKDLIGAKVGVYPNIDIRSDASYVVLSPSTHVSGNKYYWINEGEEIADAPLWLYKKESSDKKKTDWEEFFKGKKGEGVRNMSSTQLAGKILYELSPELWDTLGVMLFKQWNREYNNPSLPERELLTTWESIKKTHLKNNKPPEKEEIPKDEEDEDMIRREFKKNKTKGTYYLAKHVVNKYNIITVGEKEREMYVYKNGMYHAFGENFIIYPEIQRVLGEETTRASKGETFSKIADMTAHERDVFETADIRYIPLANGVFDFETEELLPHDPKYRFKYQFPIVYDPMATCPKTEAFFNQVLLPEQRVIMEEWIGYYFYRNYMFKKAMVLVGEGDTGKTTLLEVITYLLGRENISSISLQKMTGDKFSGAQMYEKHGNLVDELSSKDISDTDAFKMATGNGSITGEYKFGNQFTFQNFAKLTFACNRIPDLADNNDTAFFNRWMIIRFENTIEKKIPNFIKTLTTEVERSGLFNLAIKGLRRLLKQECFSYNNTADETKLEMMRSGSSIAMFASDMLERKDGGEVSKEDMYEAYAEYCKEKNISTQTKDALGKRLGNYATFLSDGLIDGFDGKGKPSRVRGWRNVRLKTMSESDKKAEDDFNAIKESQIINNG